MKTVIVDDERLVDEATLLQMEMEEEWQRESGNYLVANKIRQEITELEIIEEYFQKTEFIFAG